MKNTAASVRAKLLNLSRSSKQNFPYLLEEFVTGRFLHRLISSSHKDQFILKGAQLFKLWSGQIHRPTRDIDFLGSGEISNASIHEIFTSITEQSDTPQDGIEWLKITVDSIRRDQKYGGVRATIEASIDHAKVSLQIDVGVGDKITPRPKQYKWISLLDFPEFDVLAYPPETVIAEKLEAAVSLSMENSRMKDFYDLHWLSNHQTFDYKTLHQAMQNTFNRRSTKIPTSTPLALTKTFATNPTKQTQWKAFLRKNKLQSPPLEIIIPRLNQFLNPLFQTTESPKTYTPEKGWT